MEIPKVVVSSHGVDIVEVKGPCGANGCATSPPRNELEQGIPAREGQTSRAPDAVPAACSAERRSPPEQVPTAGLASDLVRKEKELELRLQRCEELCSLSGALAAKLENLSLRMNYEQVGKPESRLASLQSVAESASNHIRFSGYFGSDLYSSASSLYASPMASRIASRANSKQRDNRLLDAAAQLSVGVPGLRLQQARPSPPVQLQPSPVQSSPAPPVQWQCPNAAASCASDQIVTDSQRRSFGAGWSTLPSSPNGHLSQGGPTIPSSQKTIAVPSWFPPAVSSPCAVTPCGSPRLREDNSSVDPGHCRRQSQLGVARVAGQSPLSRVRGAVRADPAGVPCSSMMNSTTSFVSPSSLPSRLAENGLTKSMSLTNINKPYHPPVVNGNCGTEPPPPCIASTSPSGDHRQARAQPGGWACPIMRPVSPARTPHTLPQAPSVTVETRPRDCRSPSPSAAANPQPFAWMVQTAPRQASPLRGMPPLDGFQRSVSPPRAVQQMGLPTWTPLLLARGEASPVASVNGAPGVRGHESPGFPGMPLALPLAPRSISPCRAMPLVGAMSQRASSPAAPGRPTQCGPPMLLQSRCRTTALVPAAAYIPDISDAIDVRVANCLRTLAPNYSAALMIRRLEEPGQYEIDGGVIWLEWGQKGGVPAIVVKEIGAKSGTPPPKLEDYISQAAHVALSPAGMRHRRNSLQHRITFHDETPAAEAEEDRRTAMQKAVFQAEFREQVGKSFSSQGITTAMGEPGQVAPIPLGGVFETFTLSHHSHPGAGQNSPALRGGWSSSTQNWARPVYHL